MPWAGLRRDGDGAQAAALLAAALVSLLAAAALQVSLAAALALVALVACGAFVARLGSMGVALLLAAALPWLVVFGAVEPKLAETFTAGTFVVVVLVVAAPKHDGTRASARLRLGMILFYVPVIVALARAPHGAQFIEAAKYFVFPFMVLAVTEATNRAALKQLSRVVFISGLIAVALNLMIGAAGLGHSYYAAGDIQGFAGEHDFALLAAAVAAASLGMGAGWKWTAAAAMGTVATIATGVRSALPGLVLVVLARLLSARARLRTIVAVVVVVAAVLASGAGNVVVRRFTHDQALGQYSSFVAFGSGRGEIYTTAIHAWWVSSPVDWAIGTGLRSVETLEQRATGNAVVAQSDVVQVGVETGLIGLIGLVLIWASLIGRARSKLPLLVLLAFALFNGSLEYGAPVVIALLLSVCPWDAVDAVGAGCDPAARTGTAHG